MAQLKSTVVQGSLRVTDTTYTTDLILSGSKTARYALIAPTSAGAPTWRALTKADISDFPTNLNQFTNGPGYVTSSGVTSITIKTTSPLSGGSDTATTSTRTYTLSLGTVGVGNGGTGATSFTANSLIMSGSTTTAALTTRAITDRTSVSALTNVATWANSTNIPTVNLIAYWDGRYQTTSDKSNLAYCNKGKFGDMAIKTKGNGFSDSSNTISVAYGTSANTAVQGNQTIFTLNGGAKNSGSSASFYAPTSAGTANQILVSAGGTSAPTWKATASGAAYATSANGELTFGTLPVAQGGTGLTTADPHKVLIGPSTGTTANAPIWRILEAADLPIAAANALGIMKVGTGLGVSSGTVSVSYGTSANTALQGDAYLVKLNGLSKTAASVADFYAPTSVGTNGQFLKSVGSGEPTWSALPAASTTVAGIVKLGASGGAATYEHTHSEYALSGHTHAANAVIKPVSFTSVTLDNNPGYTYSDSWITTDTAIIATDLQTLSLPGIVTWTISAGKIVFKCTVSTSLSFSIMMLKQA